METTTNYFNNLRRASAYTKDAQTEKIAAFLKKTVKVEGGEVKPKSLWATLFWPIIKELVSYLLQLLVLRLNEDVEDILKK